jgi:hypothetical protein
VAEEKIEVFAYSGYPGKERPRTILLHGENIEVTEVLKQWIQERSDHREIKRFYQVKGSDGNFHSIYYDKKSVEWFHGVKD